MQADHQRHEPRAFLPHHGEVAGASGGSGNPVAVLPPRRFDVALPAVRHEEDIGDRLLAQLFGHQLAHHAVRVAAALAPFGVKVNLVELEICSGYLFNAHKTS